MVLLTAFVLFVLSFGFSSDLTGLEMLRTTGRICWKLHHLNTRSVSKKPNIYRDKYTPRENPGIQRRLKLIAEDEPDIEKAQIDQQSVEELDLDFMEAAALHDEIESDIKGISNMRKLKITERKYFRSPKEPNMLTWSEKEQMIQLHQKDPEEWSPEVLAESFPASPSIIKKVLRAKWKPLTPGRLKAHDQKVSENWIAFHKGELKVHDLKLQAHLSKFGDRKNGVRIVSDEEATRLTEIILPKPKKTEFLSLVTSFKPKADEEKVETENKIRGEDIEPPKQIGDRYLTNVIDRSGAYYTLDQYRERLSQQLDKCSEDQENIKAILNNVNNRTSVETNSTSENYVAPSERFKPNAIVHQKRHKSRLQLVDSDSNPDKITIPKDKWKPGMVYRVDDCFYDDQGDLLYRVPGLKA